MIRFEGFEIEYEHPSRFWAMALTGGQDMTWANDEGPSNTREPYTQAEIDALRENERLRGIINDQANAIARLELLAERNRQEHAGVVEALRKEIDRLRGSDLQGALALPS